MSPQITFSPQFPDYRNINIEELAVKSIYTKSENLLKITLWLLAVYFLFIALAHITSTKLPLLFVYYNVPSEAYQDNIISFLSFGWAVFFATTARDPERQLALVKAILIAAAGAIAGLSYNNATVDFAHLSGEINVWSYWAQTGVLTVVTCWLLVLYRTSCKKIDAMKA